MIIIMTLANYKQFQFVRCVCAGTGSIVCIGTGSIVCIVHGIICVHVSTCVM